MVRKGKKRSRTLAASSRDYSVDDDAVDEVQVDVQVGVEAAMDEEEEDDGPAVKAGQALPIAILADDFDGEPEDGATYLALANRANDSLPFYKRVNVPEHLRGSPAPPAAAPAPTGRHPALPRESWEVLFAVHFAAYRADMALRWPGDMLPYPATYPPLPSAGDAPRWLAFINGVSMGKSKRQEEMEENEEYEEDMELDDEKGMVEMTEEEAINMAEEEAMNSAPPPPPPEPELVAREPLVSVLQRLNSTALVRVLKHLTRFTATALERLEDEPDLAADADPFPPTHARWAFALLATIERHLSGDETAVLREFARTVAAAAAWRWNAAVARGEVCAVPVKLGFYGQGGGDEKGPMLGEVGGPEAPAAGYNLGARWKVVRDARARSEATPRPESAEAGHQAAALDECLARCWMCAHAVVAGWAQWDLVDDFTALFARLPRE